MRRKWLFWGCLGLILMASCDDGLEKNALADMQHQVQFLDSAFEIQPYAVLKMWAKRNGRYSGDNDIFVLADSVERIYRSEKNRFDFRIETTGVKEIIDRYRNAFSTLTGAVIGKHKMLPPDEQRLMEYKGALDSLIDYEEDAVCLFAQYNLALLRYKIMCGLMTGCHLSSSKCFLYSFRYSENDSALVLKSNYGIKLPDTRSFLCLDEVKFNGTTIPFFVKFPVNFDCLADDTLSGYTYKETEDIGYFRKKDLETGKSYHFRSWITIEKPTGDEDFFLIEKTIPDHK